MHRHRPGPLGVDRGDRQGRDLLRRPSLGLLDLRGRVWIIAALAPASMRTTTSPRFTADPSDT
jgi:hypothetical protein